MASLNVGQELVGMPQLNAQLLRLAGDGLALPVEQALFETGELIAGDSKELTPVDTGNLRDSTFVLTHSLEDLGPTAEPSGDARALVEDGGTLNAVIGVGGPSAEYAIVQHERLDYHHTVGQAKFLETAFNLRSPELVDRIAERVRAFVGGQGESAPGSGFE